MKLLQLGAATAVALSLCACATVTRGTKQKFSIVSEPSGADVTLTTGGTCTTPCKMKLKRKTEFSAHIAKPGYEPVDVAVKSSVHGGCVAGAAGNILIGGIIGGVVDGSNGSMRDLRPNPISVTLVAVGSTPAASPVPAEAPAAPTDPAAAPAATATPPTVAKP